MQTPAKPKITVGDQTLSDRDAHELRRLVRKRLRFVNVENRNLKRILTILDGDDAESDGQDGAWTNDGEPK